MNFIFFHRISAPNLGYVWEQRKLDDVVIERNDQSVASEEYPLMSFTGLDGVTPKSQRYNREFLVKSSNKKYKRTKLQDLIYSSNNLETGSIGINQTGNAVISPVYSIFFVKDYVSAPFLNLLIQQKSFINKMIHYRQGVVYGQWRIHERDFLKISTELPIFEEQTVIGNFIYHLDNLIASNQGKEKSHELGFIHG